MCEAILGWCRCNDASPKAAAAGEKRGKCSGDIALFSLEESKALIGAPCRPARG